MQLSVAGRADMDISSESIVYHHDDSIGGNEKYSWVIKATYSSMEKLAVAAKSLNKHAGISNDNLTRYLEAVHCSKLDHENILRILGAYVDGTVFRIIMKLMPTSLRNYLDENGALENMPLKCIANGIAEGLQYLHSDQPHLSVTAPGKCFGPDGEGEAEKGHQRPHVTLAENPEMFEEAAPLLFGVSFEKKMREHLESLIYINKMWLQK